MRKILSNVKACLKPDAIGTGKRYTIKIDAIEKPKYVVREEVK